MVATAVAAQAAAAVAVARDVETADMAAAVTAVAVRPVVAVVVVAEGARRTPEADPLPAHRAAAPVWVVRAPLQVLREARAAAGRVDRSARTETLGPKRQDRSARTQALGPQR